MQPKTQSFPSISEQDLKHPFRLNEILKWLGEQVLRTQASSGPFRFGEGTITFPGTVKALSSVEMSGSIRMTSNKITASSLREFADNATALAGGLTQGDLYRTATGEVRVVY